MSAALERGFERLIAPKTKAPEATVATEIDLSL